MKLSSALPLLIPEGREHNVSSGDGYKYYNNATILLALATTIPTVAYYFIYQKIIKPNRLDDTLPGPKPHPLLGLIPFIKKNQDLWPTITTKLANQYKCTWGGSFPTILSLTMNIPPAIIFISNTTNIKYVTKDNFDNYVKGKVFQGVLGDFLGEGIFGVDGKKWKVHRKVMSHMFSRNLLRYSAFLMEQKLNDVLHDLKCKLDDKAIETKTESEIETETETETATTIEIDMQDLSKKIFFDATSKIAFGIDLNTSSLNNNDDNDNNNNNNNSNNSHDDNTKEKHPLLSAFDEITYLLYRRFNDLFSPLKRVLNIGSEKRIRELNLIIDDFALSVVAKRRMKIEKSMEIEVIQAKAKANVNVQSEEDKSMDTTTTTTTTPTNTKNKTTLVAAETKTTTTTTTRTPVEKFDLLTKYIEYAHKENEDISDRDMRDVIVSVMFAGRDSTASTLSWIFYELERNPHVKERLLKEVKSICGSGENAEYTFETMNKLDYTHFVILETLRFHPPVPENVRYATTSDTLPDGTHIPAGSAIGLSYCAMGRNEDLWGKDVMEFKPERFLEEKEPSSFKFPVFHAGPRVCIGKPLAMMNLKMALSILLSSDIIEFTDKIGHSGEYEMGLTMSMKDQFKIEISRKSSMI